MNWLQCLLLSVVGSTVLFKLIIKQNIKVHPEDLGLKTQVIKDQGAGFSDI